MFLSGLFATAGEGTSGGIFTHGKCKISATASAPDDTPTSSATHEVDCYDNFDGRLTGIVEWPPTAEKAESYATFSAPCPGKGSGEVASTAEHPAFAYTASCTYTRNLFGFNTMDWIIAVAVAIGLLAALVWAATRRK